MFWRSNKSLLFWSTQYQTYNNNNNDEDDDDDDVDLLQSDLLHNNELLYIYNWNDRCDMK